MNSPRVLKNAAGGASVFSKKLPLLKKEALLINSPSVFLKKRPKRAPLLQHWTTELDKRTGQLDWTTQLEKTNGQEDWTTELDKTNGQDDRTTELDKRTGLDN